ncbi:hypothetical protein JSY14_08760 [Brachybacterium sp. EF45031]|uniref:hypothetical protein n=1 Tax=Brachybacterium sillae TaxID=2810536 RepID=UPI00217E708D|nr:hypothetical protein [Brachybacterium sillae]MCS6712105.1 hypothetical protein [Brachybacterium sillae]
MIDHAGHDLSQILLTQLAQHTSASLTIRGGEGGVSVTSALQLPANGVEPKYVLSLWNHEGTPLRVDSVAFTALAQDGDEWTYSTADAPLDGEAVVPIPEGGVEIPAYHYVVALYPIRLLEPLMREAAGRPDGQVDLIAHADVAGRTVLDSRAYILV